MSVIYVLIPIAALITAIAIYIFFWAVKTDQFDDLEKQGMSILFDEEENQKATTQDAKETQVSSASAENAEPSKKSAEKH